MIHSTYSFVRADGMDLCTEHDACEEWEEEAFKDAEQGEDEGERAGHDGITALEVLTHTTEKEPGNHSKTKHRHWHDVELHRWRIVGIK